MNAIKVQIIHPRYKMIFSAILLIFDNIIATFVTLQNAAIVSFLGFKANKLECI